VPHSADSAKGREQLSRVVTVRWYPARLVSCGGENTKKGLGRPRRPAAVDVAFRGSHSGRKETAGRGPGERATQRRIVARSAKAGRFLEVPRK